MTWVLGWRSLIYQAFQPLGEDVVIWGGGPPLGRVCDRTVSPTPAFHSCLVL
ncbi:hypothetical protein PN477_01490 [Spirulina subsalsa CS-330]|uniref:hypothetical protein n=1 Tax=Spirulina TaxID=1154 RepID=UPI00232F17F6|nr:hypothetical protein [Spirulina subsalsa]MDB9493286.1 hypothetical protein [Spirulina subsalsa CS-330]